MSAKDDQLAHLLGALRLAIKMLREAKQDRYADYLQLLIQLDPTIARRFLD